MKQVTKRAVLAALTTFTMAASLSAVTATEASAINEVTCGVSNEYLQVRMHDTASPDREKCFANAGTLVFDGSYEWITRISTGNNRVQWHGDGRWQPDTPINKWTVFTWPNHPSGVRFDKIKIL
jgi:hypothetical protein